MSSYRAATITNEFKVTNESRYFELLKNLVCDEEIFTETKTTNNECLHSFKAYGTINYRINEDIENPELDFDYFLDELQKILPENEVFTMIEVGHESLNYAHGYGYVVTKTNIEFISVRDWMDEMVKKSQKSTDIEK